MLGKLFDNKLKMAYGNILKLDDEIIVNPREKDWIRSGFKVIKDNRQLDKDGYYQVPEYSEDDEYIYINYHYEEITEEFEVV